MLGRLKRPVLTATFLGITSLAALVGGAVTATEASTYRGRSHYGSHSGRSHYGSHYGRSNHGSYYGGYSRGGFAGPVVVGFSYGNPYGFGYGHVHRSAVDCDYGPTYYYPRQRVYGHQYSGCRYQRYSRPIYGHVGRRHHSYLLPHQRFIRDRVRTHLDHLRGDWDDD